MILTITYHHISPSFCKSLPKTVSPNSLGKSSPRLLGIHRPQTFDEAMRSRCLWLGLRSTWCEEYADGGLQGATKNQKKQPTNDQPMNQPNHPKKRNSTNFFDGLGWWRDASQKRLKIKDCYQNYIVGRNPVSQLKMHVRSNVSSNTLSPRV